MKQSTNSKGVGTLSATVIRADGTREELGVLSKMSMSEDEMLAIVEYNKRLADLPAPPDNRTADELQVAEEAAHAANAEESAKNEAENKTINPGWAGDK